MTYQQAFVESLKEVVSLGVKPPKNLKQSEPKTEVPSATKIEIYVMLIMLLQ